MLTRRAFLGTAGLAAVAPAIPPAPRHPGTPAPQLPALAPPSGPPDQVARDEAYWKRVAAYYRVSGEFTNMEAGFFGMMAAPTLAAYHAHIDRVNRESSFYARRGFETDIVAVREKVAAFLGARTSEIALTRGATEALQCLIAQYRLVGPGDAVMYADLDYNAMQFAMNWLAERRGATVVRFDLPEPGTRQGILDAYARALEANPRVRLLLLTHLNNKNGLIIPVKEIAAMARARGADVVVDAAHSFGQVDLRLDDLGADFVGCNLHKWIGAPVGVGAMYIREGRLPDIDRAWLDESMPAGSILSRVHSGTANFATFLAVPTAIEFHQAVGGPYKAARVRYLRDQWVGMVRGTPGIDVLTPDDRDLVAAISSFRIRGRTGKAENQAVVNELYDRHKLFTVWRTGLSRGDCVRVTPSLYNTPADAQRLASALGSIAARG